MKILDHVQGSSEWWAARAGVPTASEFGRIITPVEGKRAKWDSYLAEKVAEAVGWRKVEFRGSPDIERGKMLEAEARRWLAFELGEDIEECGFCVSDCGRYGASPDGLIYEPCENLPACIPVELKCPDLHTLIKWRMAGGLPSEHKCQVHGEMWVTGADHCWFAAYADHEAIANLLVKVERDDFTEKLGAEVEAFCDRLAELKTELIDDPAYH